MYFFNAILRDRGASARVGQNYRMNDALAPGR